jgi:nucleotide-binding universal stress UspA family protein
MDPETPFRHPLLATEHTEFDTGAERVAFALARHCEVPLAAVLPLVTNPEYEATAPELVAQAEAKAHARLVELRAAAETAGVALDAAVRRGDDAARAIVAEAARCGADLIVARRRGRQSFLAKLMVGEMVTQVATDAPCDVLLVPRTAQMWSQRVLAAVDDSPGSARVAETAARIAARCGMPLTIATTTAHDPRAGRAQADAIVAGAAAAATCCGTTAECQVLVGPAAEAIVELAGTQGADLVVVGRSDPRRSAQRRRLGATAHRVIGLAAGPVLIVRT